jgi:hypothetical protein
MFEMQPLDNPRGWRRHVGDAVSCPACSRRSVYSRELDRFFHLDGTANRFCWVAISRGELELRPVVAGDGDEHQAPGVTEGDDPGRAA